MILHLIGHDMRFDIVNVCTLFFPREGFTEAKGKELTVRRESDRFEAEFSADGAVYRSVCPIRESVFDGERCAVKRAVYDVLRQATGISSPWGILTGVRPVRFYEKVQAIYGEQTADFMEREYLVQREKTELCRTVTQRQAAARAANLPHTAALYVSIPFCPSRCKYCSFVSQVTGEEGSMIPAYLDVLLQEIRVKTAQAKENGDRITTVYVGGGTPTTLSAEQLQQLTEVIGKTVDVTNLLEYTVEAGRPDTITPEKLTVLEANGVTRVSVNPQTLNDSVLQTVGRKHSADDFFQAYAAAKQTKMRINVDLIAGLPGDTPESYEATLRRVCALQPDNITVHTLYLKRAADYGAQDAKIFTDNGEAAAKMVEFSRSYGAEKGYLPYYLYRQKNTVGNLENVGYAKEGAESYYNIYMMDDLQTVYGAGANAITKMIRNGTASRVSNTKYPTDYIKNGWNDRLPN